MELEDILKPGFVPVAELSSTATRYRVTKVEPNKYYKIGIRSRNCGLESAVVELTIAASSIPNEPSMPQV